jgi:hypothetical protein
MALGATTGCTDRSPTDPGQVELQGASFASAHKPVRTTDVVPFSVDLDCGDFTGRLLGTFTDDITTFFDNTGSPIRERHHFQYRSTAANLSSGKTLKDHSNYIATVNLLTGEVEANGVVYNLKDKETGLRIKDIGRITFDPEGNVTFEAGRHDVDAFSDATPQYCAVLA